MSDNERFRYPTGQSDDEPRSEDKAADGFSAAEHVSTGGNRAEEPVSEEEAEAVVDLGRRLADAMAPDNEGGGYQPVVVFGMSNSGKTAMLLSLFAAIMSDHELETGLSLDGSLLGSEDPVGRNLHTEAELTFQNRTQDFIAGKPIQKTTVAMPFFVPVTFSPRGKPAVRFAFLESSGEWYRPVRTGGTLFPQLKEEINSFIFNYQGPIIFIYLLPCTQVILTGDQGTPKDIEGIREAQLAMVGALDGYNRVRENFREKDQHLMLVTKWDVRSRTKVDRPSELEADRHELMEFCKLRYPQALASYHKLPLNERQLLINAYCAGLMNDQGILQLQHGHVSRAAVQSYPLRLWTWLYRVGLRNMDLTPVAPFPEPPKRLAIVRLFLAFLDKLTN
jgi:hypothetical protein